MRTVSNERHDEERAFYGSCDLEAVECDFDGPADGESAFKESRNISAIDCYFNLRYPFWHDKGVSIVGSNMTELCRAALWYSSDISVVSTNMHGTKALRECSRITVCDSDVISDELGWSCDGLTVTDSSLSGSYMLMRSKNISLERVGQKGKYSFQYIENAVFENCNFDTKDAFWHAKGVTVRNSVVKGEYLAWYAEDITFENCKIIGTQPFCYCKGLRLINCEMHECDLAFEKSEVCAEIATPVISIKNPTAGSITVPSVGEIILDDPNARAEIKVTGEKVGITV